MSYSSSKGDLGISTSTHIEEGRFPWVGFLLILLEMEF
jgi:hypothetical protein